MTITRDDLEAKAQELVGAVESTGRSVRDRAIVGAILVGVIVGVAFVIGRRRGQRNKTVVEVYKV